MINNLDIEEYANNTILTIGFANWFGSDARALSQSLRKYGQALIEINSDDFISWRWSSLYLKIIKKLILWLLIKEYNKEIIKYAKNSSFDFILVFKGAYIFESTFKELRNLGKPIYNFYPDVSFVDHGSYIPKSLKYYDCVFTTKSFHGKNEINKFQIRELIYTRHGFDPEVHRFISLTDEQTKFYKCDICFVGCWSPEKEDTLIFIANNRPNLKINIWGIGWNNSSKKFKLIFGKNIKSAFGDELAIIYNSSKINLGLLSRSKSDKEMYDRLTARTFQIPASKSLVIHEENEEIMQLFDSHEIILFKNNEDLLDKIDLLLANNALRYNYIINGYNKCRSMNYNYDNAAKAIITKYSKTNFK